MSKSRTMLRVVFLLLSLLPLCGCDHSAGGKVVPPKDNSAWREKFNMPPAVRPDEFPFASPRVRDAFLKLDSAARDLADTTWVERAGDTYPYLNWNGGSGGYNQTYRGQWSSTRGAHTGRPEQNVSTLVTLHDKPRLAYGFIFLAVRNQADDWSAWFSYDLREGLNGSREGFVITLHHPELHPQKKTEQDSQSFRFPPEFAAYRRDDKYQYSFRVFSGSRTEEGPPAVDRVAGFWVSAESFQELALEDLDRLEANLREAISSGKAFEVQTLGGPTGADVPHPVSLDIIPETITAEVLAEGLAQIERHRQLVRAHYAALHETAVATFPRLAEIVQSARSHSTSDAIESEKRNP